MNTQRTRTRSVVVADPQHLFREGVVRIVRQRPEFSVARVVTEGRAAVHALLTECADVAFVAADLPFLTGDRVVQAIRREGCETRIVTIVPADDDDDAYRMVAAGALGCLTRNSTSEEVQRALEHADRGLPLVAPDAQHGLLRSIRLRSHDDRPVLSSREREVLVHTAQGLSNAGIASALFLSEATVKTHLSHAFAKLEVSDRAAAVAQALRRGLIE